MDPLFGLMSGVMSGRKRKRKSWQVWWTRVLTGLGLDRRGTSTKRKKRILGDWIKRRLELRGTKMMVVLGLRLEATSCQGTIICMSLGSGLTGRPRARGTKRIVFLKHCSSLLLKLLFCLPYWRLFL